MKTNKRKKRFKYILFSTLSCLTAFFIGSNQANTEYEHLVTDIKYLQEELKEAEAWFKLTDDEKEEISSMVVDRGFNSITSEDLSSGFRDDISYDELIYNSDSYLGEKLLFEGSIYQIIEGRSTSYLLLSLHNEPNSKVYCEYRNSNFENLTEGDTVTIKGYNIGTFTYDTVSNNKITVPAIILKDISS